MSKNTNLHKAIRAKNDEFYTQLSDIENELKHYKEYFRDKVIFCNCNDTCESSFFRHFAMSFNDYGLKKLIAVSYGTGEGASACKIEITEVRDFNGDGAADLSDVEYFINNEKGVLTQLQGDGDFRSDECIELLKEADIVVTNPPFSLFREYVAQLIEYEKKFIIIGNKNAITYKEIFPLLKENKMWLGYGFNGGNAYFAVPKETDYADGVYNKDTGLVKFRNCCWFTNLDTTKRHEELLLWKTYNPEEYSKYDNYDAINVNKTADIPCDYDGIMGVPITFLDKYNPEQFEIIGRADANIAGENNACHIPGFKDKGGAPLVNGSFVYKRILIRRRK